MENEGQHIPNRLRLYRNRHEYLQEDIAFLLGHSSTNMISRWENGSAIPSFHNLLKLSIIYSVFPTDLYFDTYQQLQTLIATKKQLLEQQDK